MADWKGVDMTKRTCSVPDCNNDHFTKGLCGKHHQRVRKYGTTDLPRQPTVDERFWAKVDKTDTCWLWTSATNGRGYGAFTVGRKKVVRAHRYAWERLREPIPAGMELDHINKCRNPRCVNPDHLRVVTHKQNIENHGGPRADNKLGIRGVHYDSKRRTWCVQVWHQGERVFHKNFRSLEAAEAAAIEVRNRYHTHNDADRTDMQRENKVVVSITMKRPATVAIAGRGALTADVLRKAG